MKAARTVHLVVPEGIDDPLRPSGGNTYDRRLSAGLRSAGWSVGVHEVARAWDDRPQSLDRTLRALPDGSLVVVDGLVASTLPEVVVPASRRLRVVALLHMPIGIENESCRARERDVLRSVPVVVTPSDWSRDWLLTAYDLDPARVHVAHPGVDAAEVGNGTPGGGAFLCVGGVTPGKGHDVLLAALAQVADLSWRCVCVGAVSLAPDFVARLRRCARRTGLERRFVLTGTLTGTALDAAYAQADVLVLASRAETYGMVVTEALARGVPVITSDVGGVPEALGTTADGARPGLLTDPEDVAALADALRRWLGDADLRQRLRASARRRRADLTDWSETTDRVGRVLAGVAA